MIRRIEPHAAEPTFTGTVVLSDEGAVLGSVSGLNIEGANTESVISGSFGHVAVKPRTWGGLSVHYNFVTGSSVSSGEMNFDSLTGSMVTQFIGAWLDAEGGLTFPRLEDIGGAFGARIIIWSEHDPSKWWLGSMGPSFSSVPPSSTTLSLDYIHHQGGETPFDQGESIVVSTGYQRNQTGTVVIYDEGDFLANFKEMRFIGDGVEVFHSGSYAAVSIQDTELATYIRAGVPIALNAATGIYWQVPDQVYATGSLSVSINGLSQRPVTDYTEQHPVSGTFQLAEGLITGSVLSSIWGAPIP